MSSCIDDATEAFTNHRIASVKNLQTRGEPRGASKRFDPSLWIRPVGSIINDDRLTIAFHWTVHPPLRTQVKSRVATREFWDYPPVRVRAHCVRSLLASCQPPLLLGVHTCEDEISRHPFLSSVSSITAVYSSSPFSSSFSTLPFFTGFPNRVHTDHESRSIVVFLFFSSALPLNPAYDPPSLPMMRVNIGRAWRAWDQF